MTDDPQRRIEYELFLRKFVMIVPTNEVIRQVTHAMEPLDVPAGGVVFEKGEPPRSIYFIVSGEIELAGDDATFRFGRGDVIGVIDASARRTHSRTARAITNAQLLVLSFSDWLDALEDHPTFSSRLRRSVGTALHTDRLTLGPRGGFPEPPPDDGLGVLADSVLTRLLAMREVDAFSSASVQALTELADKAHTVHASPGQLVFPPGAAADKILIVLSGEVHAERRIAPVLSARFGRSQLVLEASAFGEVLGEYAISAVTDASIIVIAQTDIDDVTEDHFDLFTSFLRATTVERERLRVYVNRPPSSPLRLKPKGG